MIYPGLMEGEPRRRADAHMKGGYGGLLGFEPQTGKTLFHYKWRAKPEESVNASNPVVVGDKVLITECYGPGAAFLDLKGGKPKEIWTDKDKDADERAMACN